MKRPIQKNLVIGSLNVLHNDPIGPTVAMLDDVVKKDENAKFKIGPSGDSSALLSVDYVDYEEVKPKDAGILASCNSDDIQDNTICGCFACLSIFKGIDIKQWNPTRCDCLNAVCPCCNCETVVPNLDAATFLVNAHNSIYVNEND